MICNKIGCEHDALYQLGWKAWAVGFPKTSIPIETFTNIVVCEQHGRETKFEDISSPDSNARINNQLTQTGKANLDFSKAEVVLHDLLGEKIFMPEGKKI